MRERPSFVNLTRVRLAATRQNQQRWLICGLTLLLAVALLLPAHVALGELGQSHLQLAQLVGSLALLALLAVLPSFLPVGVALVLAALGLALLLFVHLFFYGLVQFSGAGFGDEVFLHLGGKSLELAWQQYPGLFVGLAGLILASVLLVRLAAWRLRRLRARTGLLLAATALICVGFSHQGLPEWMLFDAARRWYAPLELDLPPAELDRWRASGLVEVDLPKKSSLTAHPATPPRNLILIYLESVGLRVVQHPRYPRLMPELAELVARDSLLPNYQTAGFITIEGIVNSQCGTLFPFQRDSDSLAGHDGLAEQQACLADVLHRAGYRQSYLGGAGINFAGKGAFLAAHGYDRILGMEHWRELGLWPREGGWGLGDPDLYDQAFMELERLRAEGRPFNLSLLTIGTHLPGYSYSECETYSAEPFINALHCSDQLLRRWLQRIESAGFLRDTLVVITADHHVFPSPAMRRLFGDAAVEDKRLPLVVLGARAAGAVRSSAGASYDLAPTVLDLLGVEHDARFALGRSLLREESRRDYFLSRYLDVYRGERIGAGDAGCAAGIPLAPLSRCAKDELMALLGMQNRALSIAAETSVDCGRPGSARIRVPDDPAGALEFLLGGENQAARFTRRSRTVSAVDPGLRVAAFDADGKLYARQFWTQDESTALAEPPAVEGTRTALIVWRGAPGAVIPGWLGSFLADGSAAALVDANGGLHALTRTRLDGVVEYGLDDGQCALLTS